jgi:hypothetical protein
VREFSFPFFEWSNAMLNLPVANPVETLAADGCVLAQDMGHGFIGLYQATKFNPCRNCHHRKKEDGKDCAAMKKWGEKNPEVPQEHQKLIGGKFAGWSMKKIAEFEGISLNEARRRKQRGDYINAQ